MAYLHKRVTLKFMKLIIKLLVLIELKIKDELISNIRIFTYF